MAAAFPVALQAIAADIDKDVCASAVTACAALLKTGGPAACPRELWGERGLMAAIGQVLSLSYTSSPQSKSAPSILEPCCIWLHQHAWEGKRCSRLAGLPHTHVGYVSCGASGASWQPLARCLPAACCASSAVCQTQSRCSSL